MKIIVLTLIVTVLIVAACASPADDKKKFQKKACAQCGDDYKPVCGEEDKSVVTFGSECVLNKYNCESGKNYAVKAQGECPGKAPVRLT